MRIIGYERVSTARQGASGLGIAAQRQAIDGFVAQRGAALIARFTEVESGRNPDRPELGKALHLAKVTGATLVIAKLDRLSRNAAFLLTLRDSGVRFAAVDLPEANDLTVGIMALVAQQEREAISQAHQGGAGGGTEPRCAARQPQRRGGAQAGWQGRCAAQGGHCAQRRPACPGPRAGGRGHSLGGATSLRAIAGELNARGMLTRRGGRWHVSTVMNLLDRLGGGADAAIPADVARRGGDERRGYGVAVVTQLLVFPMFGLVTTLGQNLAIGRSSPRSRWRGATCCGGRSRRSEGDCPAAAWASR